MKSKYQKQSEANERRKGSIKMYQRSIDHISAQGAVEGLTETQMAEVLAQREDRKNTMKRKISRLEQDIKNTEKRM